MLPLITWPTMHSSSCDIVVHFVKLSTAVQCWLKVKLIEKLKLLHSLNSAQPWLRTNSQYLAKSKQNVHKYNQKYFYYLPNKLSFLSQNEFERIIFNEVILARFSSVPQKNSAKIFLFSKLFQKVFAMIYYSVYFEQNWSHNADQLGWRETQSDFVKQKTIWFCVALSKFPKYFPYLELYWINIFF